MARYSYLYSSKILKYIDSLQCKTQFIKLVILDSNEIPIKSIEGRATAGSININNSSAMRRAGSITLVTEPAEVGADDTEIMCAVSNIDTLISINKYCSIEIGIKNNGSQYRDKYDTFWFPLGIFIISNASVQYNNNGIEISASLKDKMSLLNGDAGGIITTPVTHSPEYSTNNPVKFVDILKSLLDTYGETSSFDTSIIENVPDTVSNQAMWSGTNNVYLCQMQTSKGNIIPVLTTNPSYSSHIISGSEEIKKIGDDIGLIKTDFTYPAGKDLTSNAGDSVAAVLDTIKNILGNYEYFYDIDGVFYFREIPNYLNDGSALDDITEAINEKYFLNATTERASYVLSNSSLVQTYVNAPQYNLVKNDFVVWGLDDNEQPIQYHCFLDDLPGQDEKTKWTVWLDEGSGMPTRAEEKTSTEEVSTLTTDVSVTLDLSLQVGKETVEQYKARTWRIKLYYTALSKAQPSAFDLELINKIPLNWVVYDKDNPLKIGTLKSNQSPDAYKYWIDAIDTGDASLAATIDVRQFGISKIGRRSKTFSVDSIKKLFTVRNKINYVWYNAMDYIKDSYKEQAEGWTETTWLTEIYYQSSVFKSIPTDGYLIPPSVYKCLALSSNNGYSAYDYLRSVLHESLGYNNSITLTTLPIYHLDVNQRITVQNDETYLTGDYIINSISIPLAYNGMMTINAIKAIEKI